MALWAPWDLFRVNEANAAIEAAFNIGYFDHLASSGWHFADAREAVAELLGVPEDDFGPAREVELYFHASKLRTVPLAPGQVNTIALPQIRYERRRW